MWLCHPPNSCKATHTHTPLTETHHLAFPIDRNKVWKIPLSFNYATKNKVSRTRAVKVATEVDAGVEGTSGRVANAAAGPRCCSGVAASSSSHCYLWEHFF